MVPDCAVAGEQEGVIYDKVKVFEKLGDREGGRGPLPGPLETVVPIGGKEKGGSPNAKVGPEA